MARFPSPSNTFYDDIVAVDPEFFKSDITAGQDWCLIETISDPNSSTQAWREAAFILLEGRWVNLDMCDLDYVYEGRDETLSGTETSFTAYFSRKILPRISMRGSSLLASESDIKVHQTWSQTDPVKVLQGDDHYTLELVVNSALREINQISKLLKVIRIARLADRRLSIARLEKSVLDLGSKENPSADDTQMLACTLEIAQKILDDKPGFEPGQVTTEHRTLLSNLLFRGRKEGHLPSRFYVKDVIRVGKDPVAGGGFADVWRGEWDKKPVALKVLRVFGTTGERQWKLMKQELCKEAYIWKAISHPSIMPFFGLCTTEFGPRVALVSPWMENGDLRSYLIRNSDVDRKSILHGIACGLAYMHSPRVQVVHGDIRCANVLVDSDGNPRISDFGLAQFEELHATMSGASSRKGRGSLRWQAPELVLPATFGGNGVHTTKSDIYAFGMTCLEVYTEQAPFFGKTEVHVIQMILRGERPSVELEQLDYIKNRGLTDGLWSIIVHCWSEDPLVRPEMYRLAQWLR